MDTKLLAEILQCNYYDIRTNYAWHVVMGRRQELKAEFFPIPDLESFEVMQRILTNRHLTVEQFISLCQSKASLQNLTCYYDEKQILTVRARTYTFNYYAETWAMDWEVDQEVCHTIGLKLPSWLRQAQSPNLFDPERLAELDEELYFRYSTRRQLRDWCHSPQFKIDCQLLREMLPFIEEEGRKLHLAFQVQQSQLNIILEGNDRLRIGLVKDYTPEEMRRLPSYPRQDWMLGIHEAFDSLSRWFEYKLDERHEEYEGNIRELMGAMAPSAPVDPAYALPIFRKCADPFSYADLLFSEVLGGPIPPQDMGIWPNTAMIHGQANRIGDIEAELSWNPKCKYRVEGSTIYIDLKTFSVEYDEVDQTALFTLNAKTAKLLPIQPSVQFGPNEGVTGLDVFGLTNLDSILANTMRVFRKASKCRKQPWHPAMVSAFRTLVKTWTPMLVTRNEEGYIAENVEVMFYVNESQQIEIHFWIEQETQQQTFKLDNFENEFRIWWHTTLLKEVKRLKDLSYHPETTFDLFYDAPF